jgi:alkylation response protein AidB-like acyl-CoA dehydrogenase
MYSFTPTDEQQMLIDACSRYANQDLRPAAREMEEANNLDLDLVEKGWELGLLQASMPEKYGGFGEYSALTGALAAETLAYGDLAAALAVLTPSLFTLPIYLVGSDQQKKEYIPEVIGEEWKPYTSAFLEPDFNFDPNNLKTTIEITGDRILISGEKYAVPFADQAPAMLVYANLNGKTQGVIVPADTEGIEILTREKLLGLNALPLFRIKLDQAAVPQDNLLNGPEGHELEPILTSSWIALTALAVGLSQAAFDYAVDYAKDREVFGVKVAQKQAIAFLIAEMGIEIESSRLLGWEAAWMVDQDKPDAFKQAYLACQNAADAAMMVTDSAVQILGGHGYIREHPVEMWMRNARGFQTFTGLALI